jgi:flagellar hook-associated protein 2
VGGKLEIDENKLKEAIAKDADGVMELLFHEPDESLTTKLESKMSSAEIQEKRSQSGLISRLYDNVVTNMKNVVYEAGTGDNAELYRNVSSTLLIDFVVKYSSTSVLDKQTDELEDKLDTVNDYLDTVENRYYSQFTAMEEAIQKMNTQSSWLSQQFGMTSGSSE